MAQSNYYFSVILLVKQTVLGLYTVNWMYTSLCSREFNMPDSQRVLFYPQTPHHRRFVLNDDVHVALGLLHLAFKAVPTDPIDIKVFSR